MPAKTKPARERLNDLYHRRLLLIQKKSEVTGEHENAARDVRRLEHELSRRHAQHHIGTGGTDTSRLDVATLEEQLAAARAKLVDLGDLAAKHEALEQRKREIDEEIEQLVGEQIIDIAQDLQAEAEQELASLRTAAEALGEQLGRLYAIEGELINLTRPIPGLNDTDVARLKAPNNLTGILYRLLDDIEPPRLRIRQRNWEIYEDITPGLANVLEAIKDGRIEHESYGPAFPQAEHPVDLEALQR